jgi:hypothetical protein
MEPRTRRFVEFLQDELALPTEAIALALQKCEHSFSLMPMVLWQYGLITLAQLDLIFDWLEAEPATLLSPRF